MKIYTSYYTKVAKTPIDALLIQVSNTKPCWFEKPCVSLPVNVYPDWSLINAYKEGVITYEQFCSEYRERLLQDRTPDEILNAITGLARAYGKDTVVLLCWEKTGCHRTELAKILDTKDYLGEL